MKKLTLAAIVGLGLMSGSALAASADTDRLICRRRVIRVRSACPLVSSRVPGQLSCT